MGVIDFDHRAVAHHDPTTHPNALPRQQQGFDATAREETHLSPRNTDSEIPSPAAPEVQINAP
ncbi:MAG: hypothetical protein AAFU50_10685, partial [Pseudomonadota bacterium]